MKRIVSAVIVAGVGIAFVVVTLTSHLFSVGPAFQAMTKEFRPIVKPAPIAQLKRELGGLQAVSTEFGAKVAPTVARGLGMTPSQFASYMQQNFPAVATGVSALPQLGARFGTVVNVLDQEQARFARADAIPARSIPKTTVPWMVFGAGVLAIAIGLVFFRAGNAGPIAAGVLGALLIAGPLALSMPQKASAADTMNAHLKPVYTAQTIAGAKQGLTVVQAMGTEMQTKMLPALASAMHMTPAQLQTFMAGNFPATSAGLAAMPAALADFQRVVGVFDANLSNYDTMKPVSMVPITWLLIGGGIGILVFGLVATRRRPQQMTVVEFRKAA